MKTVDLETVLYSALINDDDLMSRLFNGAQSIFNLQSPSVYPNYPTLVFSTISDVPAAYGDDVEKAHRVTIRIHIITCDGEYHELYEIIQRIMTELGYSRVQTTSLIDEERRILVIDFKIVTGG